MVVSVLKCFFFLFNIIQNVKSHIARADATSFRNPTALVNCPTGTRMMGGGGNCASATGIGWAWIIYNQPENDNTWKVICDTPKDQNIRAEAFAICF